MKNHNRHNYKAWSIKEEDYPKSADIASQIQFLTGYGVLAPSTHNSQPWLFEITGNNLRIKADNSKLLPGADPSGRNLFISLGACTANILVAAAFFKFNTSAELRESETEGRFIDIAFDDSGSPNQELSKLLPQVTKRHSDKRIVQGEAIDSAALSSLSSSKSKHTKILLTIDRKSLNALAGDSFTASASFANDPIFGKELAGFLRTDKTAAYDGMTATSSGLTNAKLKTGRFILKITSNILKVMAKKYTKMIQTSSAAGVITTGGDTWKDWVQTGIDYEKLSLEAAAQGISLCPIAALIESSKRKSLGKYFPIAGGKPQMFFRLLKYPPDNIHTPRLPTDRQQTETALVSQLQNQGIKVALHTKTVNKYKINYIEAGAGKPLLLIHGANLGWGQWLANLEQFAKDYKIIALDLPGCGGSTAVRFHKTGFNSDLVNTVSEFIKGLKLGPLAVIGHSFGGAIAIKLAQDTKLQIEKLILVSPMGFTRQVPGKQKIITLYPLAKLLSKTALKPTRVNYAKFLAEPMFVKGKVTDELLDYYWSAAQENPHNHPLLFMNGLTRPLLLKKELDLIREFKSVAQPILAIIGDKDPLTPVKKIEKLFKHKDNATLSVFVNTGHVPSIERPEKFNKTVIEFLS